MRYYEGFLLIENAPEGAYGNLCACFKQGRTLPDDGLGHVTGPVSPGTDVKDSDFSC